MLTTTQAHLVVEKIETNFGYSEVKLEEVSIIKKYDTILHIINPGEILSIIDSLEANIKELDLKDKAITLEYQLQTIRNKVQTIIPHREKRGLLNFVGTIYKWLYGTMDDSDRQEIEDHLNTIDRNNHNSIENINKQIKINQNFNETLMKLKNVIEKDRLSVLVRLNELEDYYSKVLYGYTIYIDFALKLKILQDNIEHIQDNIASARLGIIHSNILTNEEIVEYKIDFQKLQNIKLGTVIDNRDNIIFVIRIPKELITLQKTLLIPVGDSQNIELMFDPQEIVRYENQTYNFVKDKDLKNLKI